MTTKPVLTPQEFVDELNWRLTLEVAPPGVAFALRPADADRAWGVETSGWENDRARFASIEEAVRAEFDVPSGR